MNPDQFLRSRMPIHTHPRLPPNLARVWWWIRGVGAQGEHYLHLCRRCSKRGLHHVAFWSFLRCRRFVTNELRH